MVIGVVILTLSQKDHRPLIIGPVFKSAGRRSFITEMLFLGAGIVLWCMTGISIVYGGIGANVAQRRRGRPNSCGSRDRPLLPPNLRPYYTCRTQLALL